MGQRSYNQDAELILADGAAAMTADGVTRISSAAASTPPVRATARRNLRRCGSIRIHES